MQVLRARFKKEIVTEFLPPASWSKGRRDKSQKVVIICGGMPGVPCHRGLVEFFANKGFWAFYPRYRGSWESDGTFLKTSPEQDVLDIIHQLSRSFTSFGGGENPHHHKKYKLKPDAIYLVAGSFGGPAGILAARDPRVTKVVAISPVVEWRAPSKAEPLGWLEKFVHQAFGQAYRFGQKEWAKLKTGKFYNPMTHWREIDGRKIMIYHARDDKSVRWNEVAKFAKLTRAKLILRKRGGHLSSSLITQPSEWRRVSKFLKS